MGLVLEWVYGTIVSTAEKARDSAKKPLGAPSPARTGSRHLVWLLDAGRCFQQCPYGYEIAAACVWWAAA